MAEPIWAEVLITMYRSDPPEVMELSDVAKGWSQDKIEAATSLNQTEVAEALTKLQEDWSLIAARERHGVVLYSLTKEGLEVAHDRDLSSRQRQTNKTVAAFTALLVLVQPLPLLPKCVQWAATGLLILVVAWFAYRADLLNR